MTPLQVPADNYHPKIVLVENNSAEREGYSIILSSIRDVIVVNTYDRGEEAIRNLRHDKPDIVFTDLELINEDSINIIKKLKKLDPKLHVIALTRREDLSTIFDAFAAGTSGYLLKGNNHLELLDAVTEIMNNGAPMSPKIAKLVVSSFQRSPDSPLSARETEILTSLAMGKTYKITANNLHIGMETVKSHVKNIYSKLHVSSKAEAIELARQRSLI
jgi:DNA-binding NarL/FixJ family response regulator